jgi:hypothetical protein
VRDEHVQEALRRVFVYRFMRRDDFAWAPINFPGIRYDADGGLADDMHIRAPVHLIEAIRAQGDDIVFDDPEADATEAMRYILWDKWTETELGQRGFIGRLFSDRGRAQPTERRRSPCSPRRVRYLDPSPPDRRQLNPRHCRDLARIFTLHGLGATDRCTSSIRRSAPISNGR